MSNFSARLPVMLREQTKLVRVTLKLWRTLPAEQRQQFRSYKRSGNTYYQRVTLAPYDNPAVLALRKKLKAQRFSYTEQRDGDFIIFKSAT
jgi:hypothetical protein